MKPTLAAAACAGVALGAGLFLVSRIPHPSTIAAAPEFVRADAADRQKDLAFYEKRVEEIRLRELADEREEGQ